MKTDFHGMDPELLQRDLAVLVKRGKAQVFGQEDQQGVKFF
jgi:ESCRT-II complex subunit VPS25